MKPFNFKELKIQEKILLIALSLWSLMSCIALLSNANLHYPETATVNDSILISKIKTAKRLEDIEIKKLEELKLTDPLSIANCTNDTTITYWDFTNVSRDKDIIEMGEAGNRKKNFYITCGAMGSGGFISTYLFKNNQLILKKEGLYHGGAFMDQDSYFNITQATWGEANYCPRSNILEKYKYNPETNKMDLAETKEYFNSQFRTKSGWTSCGNIEFLKYEYDNSIEFNFRDKLADWIKEFEEGVVLKTRIDVVE